MFLKQNMTLGNVLEVYNSKMVFLLRMKSSNTFEDPLPDVEKIRY